MILRPWCHLIAAEVLIFLYCAWVHGSIGDMNYYGGDYRTKEMALRRQNMEYNVRMTETGF